MLEYLLPTTDADGEPDPDISPRPLQLVTGACFAVRAGPGEFETISHVTSNENQDDVDMSGPAAPAVDLKGKGKERAKVVPPSKTYKAKEKKGEGDHGHRIKEAGVKETLQVLVNRRSPPLPRSRSAEDLR
jgi:hypothetical protein